MRKFKCIKCYFIIPWNFCLSEGVFIIERNRWLMNFKDSFHSSVQRKNSSMFKKYKIFKVDQTMLIFKIFIIRLIIFKKNKFLFKLHYIQILFCRNICLRIFIELLYMNNEDSIFLNFWSIRNEINKKKIDTNGQGLINWINFSRY